MKMIIELDDDDWSLLDFREYLKNINIDEELIKSIKFERD